MIKCKLETGKSVLLRHATVDAIVVRGDEVLLGKRSEDLPEGGSWALPGGFIDRDETIMGALIREAREETNISVIDARLFAVVSDPGRDVMSRQNVSCVFVVVDWTGVPSCGPEVTDLQFFGPKSLPSAEFVAADHHVILSRYFQSRGQVECPPLVI